MGRNNKGIDPGLEYLKLIKFNRIRGKYGLADRLAKEFGKKRTEEIFNKWDKLDKGSLDFYNFKNSDYKLSMAFNEAFDTDIIRKACNYVASQKEHFGKTILEVGCESGSMTGFLATTFPDSKIVSIDRCAAAVEVAKKRLEGLNVANVEFRCCSLNEVPEKYDTVFCMRTIQENFDAEDCPFIGEPILYQFICYSEITKPYTIDLIDRLTPSGSLCVFERVGHDPLMCGWMIALNNANCGHLEDTYKEYECEESSEKNVFQAFICKPGIQHSLQEIIDLWYKTMGVANNCTNHLEGWNALAYLADNAGELVRGVYILDKQENVIGRFAVFKDCDEESMLYYFFAPGEVHLYSVGMQQKEDALKQLQEVVNHNVRLGWSYREIDIENDMVEGAFAVQEE